MGRREGMDARVTVKENPTGSGKPRDGWETGADTCKAQGDSKTLAVPAGTVAPLLCENVLVERQGSQRLI